MAIPLDAMPSDTIIREREAQEIQGAQSTLGLRRYGGVHDRCVGRPRDDWSDTGAENIEICCSTPTSGVAHCCVRDDRCVGTGSAVTRE